MQIQIKAKGASEVPLDELVTFQGTLKDLSETNYSKLHDLIITKGFDSPIQVWVDPDGKKQILDGTQRLRVLLKLREEGYEIPLIPIDLIYADNKKDAKERLLTKVSQYGSVNEIGLDEFINEADSLIDISFSELLDIPDIDFDSKESKPSSNGEPEDPASEGEESTDPRHKKLRSVNCPNCGHEFTL